MKKTKTTAISLSLFFVLALLAMTASAKQDGNSNKGGGKEKTEKNNSNSNGFGNYEEADGKTNGALHKEKTKEAAENIEEIGTLTEADDQTGKETAKKMKNEETGKKLKQIAKEEEAAGEETGDTIETVEKRGKIGAFLIGTNYKNLGQLRSSLVQSRNRIRQLTRLIGETTDPILKAELQTQITTLMEERERVKGVIASNEGQFSLFGWLFRFVNGYEDTPLDNAEETALETEVEGTLEGGTGADNISPPPPTVLPDPSMVPSLTTPEPQALPSANLPEDN